MPRRSGASHNPARFRRPGRQCAQGHRATEDHGVVSVLRRSPKKNLANRLCAFRFRPEETARSGGKMSTFAYRSGALVLSVSLVAMLGGAAQAAAPKTDAAKIANAMSAAPAAVSRNAAVAEMNQDGSMKELRKGTNGWTCVPDDP